MAQKIHFMYEENYVDVEENGRRGKGKGSNGK